MYENNAMTPADMAAVMGNSYRGNNGFGFDNGAWWIIILFLFAMNGGWGNGFGGGNQAPYWMNTNNDVQRGFDQNADLDRIDKLAHALKSLATYKAMKGYCDDEEEEWSGRRGRASNGRYMSMAPYEPGYSGYPPVYGEWRPIR